MNNAKIRGAFRSVTIWVNGVFLAVFTYSDDIVQGVQEHMPELAQYMPANVLKGLGLAVVIFNIYQRARTKASLELKGQK